jgi:RNA polymerase sigma factor (sigma-70 family)
MLESEASPRIDDRKLALRMKEKDESALVTALEIYGPKVKGYLRKQFGEVLDDGEQDDVLNEAALKLWKCAHKYDADKGGMRGWFIRIARNTAISRIRGEERHRADRLDHDPADHCEDMTPAVDSKERMRLDRLDDFIHSGLEGIERTVALNCFTVGGDADSVRLAAKLGRSRGYVDTVKSKVKKKIQVAVLALEASEDGRKEQE